MARIVLACTTGLPNTTMATRLGVTMQTVGKWRLRVVARRLDGLLDEPGSGAPRHVTDAHIERELTRTLETLPRAATYWNTRSMASFSV